MSGAGRRYVFGPLERRGLLLGLTPVQLAALAGAALAALLVVRTQPHPAGVLAALVLMLAGTAGACLPLEGRPPVAWLPVVAGWLWRRRRGPRRAQVARRGRRLSLASVSGAPEPASGVGGPESNQRPRARRRAAQAGPTGGGLRDLTAGAGVEVRAAPDLPGQPSLGVIHDRWQGTWAALLPVHGRAFALLDPSDKERRLGAWGAVLAGMARNRSPVHRIQWVERSFAGGAEALRLHLERGAAAGVGPGGARGATAAYAAYAQLLEAAGPATLEHQTVVVIAVHPRRAARALRSFGRGPDAIAGLLRREVRLLQGQLRNAELAAGDPLDGAGTVLALRGAVDPAARRLPVPLPAGWRSASGAWPLATDEAWSCLRAGGAWFATFWIAEWPRVEVGPDFLAPLLLSGSGRSVSVTMAPVPPERARRQVEAARTADAADEELRRRAGFLSTARHRRETEGVAQREAELADGHAELRFSGYVTVTGQDRAALEAACAEVEQVGQQSGLELRRLYGQQEEAFTWTLPLGRGLA